MVAIAVKPFLMTDVDLTITLKSGAQPAPAAADYAAHVSTVELVPTASTVSWKGLKRTSVFNATSSSTWVCNLGFAQDWETDDSLSNFLLEHEGEHADVHFAPVSGATAFEAELILTPGSIGGAVDTVGVGTVSLGVQGQPTKVD